VSTNNAGIYFPYYFEQIVWKDSVRHLPDTASSCTRSSIADITYFDSTNLVTRLNPQSLQNFPYVFVEKAKAAREESKAELITHLKSGEELPVSVFRNDWILPLIIFSVLIFGIVLSESGNFFRAVFKSFLFRGINESSSRDTGLIFQWQSTLFNLAAFINISLFAFLSTLWYDLLFTGENRFLQWLIIFSVIVAAVSVRHMVCVIAGNMSGEEEIFREYLVGIYQSYRLAGLLLAVFVVMVLYTDIIPRETLFYTGFYLCCSLYLFRVLRLFLIFIKRHVSIFYLILYLCALEILPFVIFVKYVTGLV
jgi:hypothetical protein